MGSVIFAKGPSHITRSDYNMPFGTMQWDNTKDLGHKLAELKHKAAKTTGVLL